MVIHLEHMFIQIQQFQIPLKCLCFYQCLAVRDQVILQDKTAAGKSSSSSALRKTVDSDIAHSGGGIRADRAAGDKSAPRRGNKRRKFSGASSK